MAQAKGRKTTVAEISAIILERQVAIITAIEFIASSCLAAWIGWQVAIALAGRMADV